MAFVVEAGCWTSGGGPGVQIPASRGSTSCLSSVATTSSTAAGRAFFGRENGGLRWRSRMRSAPAPPTSLLWRRHSRCARIQSVPRCSCAEQSTYGALLLDVGGTLLEPAEPVGEVYANFGRKYGVTPSADDIKNGFKKAYADPWPGRIRYERYGKPFWRHVVKTATGSSDEIFFEELYNHYTRGEAWKVAKGFREGLIKLRDAGVKLAVVSNFDLRLRPVLQELQVHDLFDVIIVSAEVGYEKPSPEIFEAALRQLQVDPSRAVHVGDDATADKEGATAVGIDAWLWKEDVKVFSEIVDRILEPSTHFV